MAQITCTCGARLEAGAELAGGRGRCPACGRVVAVPKAAAPQASAARKDERGVLRLASEAGERPVGEAGALVCPACKALLPPDAVLCTQCGLDLRTGEKLPPALVAGEAREEAPDSPRNPPGLWFPQRLLLLSRSAGDAGRGEPPPLPPLCPECGTALPEESARCGACGFDLVAGEAKQAAQRPAGLRAWLREPCETAWRAGAFFVVIGVFASLGGDVRSGGKIAWVPRGWELAAVVLVMLKYAVTMGLSGFFFWGLWTEREWVGRVLVGVVAVGSAGTVLLAAGGPAVRAPAAFVTLGIVCVALPAVLGWVLVLRPGATRGTALAGFLLISAADLAMVLLLGGA